MEGCMPMSADDGFVGRGKGLFIFRERISNDSYQSNF